MSTLYMEPTCLAGVAMIKIKARTAQFLISSWSDATHYAFGVRWKSVGKEAQPETDNAINKNRQTNTLFINEYHVWLISAYSFITIQAVISGNNNDIMKYDELTKLITTRFCKSNLSEISRYI